jgi:hypothetical protein
MDPGTRSDVLAALRADPKASELVKGLEPLLVAALAALSKRALAEGVVPGTAEAAARNDGVVSRKEVYTGMRAELVDLAGAPPRWHALEELGRWLLRHGHDLPKPSSG